MKELTKKQKKVLRSYNKGKSVYDIAAELKISRQAVEKHLNACIKKGRLQMVAKKRVAYPHATYLHWRIHGLHFLCKPWYYMDKYHKNLDRVGGFNIKYKHWRLILHRNSIEIRQIRNHEYKGHTQEQVTNKLIEGFDADLAKMEQIYGFKVRKERKQNIRLCRIHLVKGDSALSKSTDEFIRLYNKLGECYLIIDKSKGGHDHEYVNTNTHKIDADTLEPVFQDYLDNCPRPLEVWQIVKALADKLDDITHLQRESASILFTVVKMLQPNDKPVDNHEDKKPPMYIN
jgi:hypothetical protein